MNDEEYMEIAYQEALKALKHDDVPIGCIIVKFNSMLQGVIVLSRCDRIQADMGIKPAFQFFE